MTDQSITDSDRLEWLEAAHNQGGALVSDDCGHWAMVFDGFQSVPEKAPADVRTSFFIQKHQWKKTVREAIDAAIADEGEGEDE